MIISKAPLRVSFLGGGSDFPDYFEKHEGAVLGTAINKYAYVTLAPYNRNFHGTKYKLAYSKLEHADSIDEIIHPAIRECIRMAAPEKPLELHYISDIPARTGLGSSSSFVAAILLALNALNNRIISPFQLAADSIKIEREILAEAGGWQDQIFASYGGFNLIKFGPGKKFHVIPLPLPSERLALIKSYSLMIYTGIKRNSFEIQEKLDFQPESCELFKKLTSLAVEGANCITSGRIDDFGKLLGKGWEYKKKTSRVTMPLIDQAYDTAMRNGAFGGKLLGAGQGGFLFFIAPPDRHRAIIEAMPDGFQSLDIELGAQGASIIHYMEN